MIVETDLAISALCSSSDLDYLEKTRRLETVIWVLVEWFCRVLFLVRVIRYD